MSSRVFPVIGARIFRGTLLDSCGVPAYGDRAQIASEGLVSVAVTANYDDGNEKSVTNAGGKKCIYVPAKPELLNYSLDLTFCSADPDFYTLATGMPAIYDPVTGQAIGYKTNRGVRPHQRSWALEAWSDAQGSASCGPDGEEPFGYSLWPFLTGARVGDYTLEDNAVTFTVSSALTKDGSGWAEGPYLVVRDENGDPAPLQPSDVIALLDHDLRVYTTVPPPEETDGLVPLDDPDSADATTGTAGIPGTFNGVRPFDLPELVASTITSPSGATAWSGGQYVILGDGSKAHWAGSGATPKWVAGAAA